MATKKKKRTPRKKHGRQYCDACGRWIGTWDRGEFEKRENFGRFCQRDHALRILCVDCWPDHELDHINARPGARRRLLAS